MIHSIGARRVCLCAAACSGMLAFVPNPAEAKLVLETRFVGRTGGESVQPGDVLSFDVFAVVTGRNEDLTDEALQSIHGRFISKDVDGGFLRGNLSSAPLAPYNDLPSTGGTAQDLDGDGDLDLGGTDATTATGWFVARVSPIKGIPFSTGEPQEFKFASLNFTVTSVLGAPEDLGDTLIQFEQRQFETAGIWIVDGQMRDWTVDPGIVGKPSLLLADASMADPDGFFFPPTSLSAVLVPEPTAASLLLISSAGLLHRRARRKQTGVA